MSSLNENEEDTTTTDGDDSRPASRKPSSTKQRLSVVSNGNIGGGSGISRVGLGGVNDSCTIRHMKIKERSCSERSDSGFSECATHSSGTCTCEKKSDEGVRKEIKSTVPASEEEVIKSRPVNHKLLKNKLERIASLQFDEEENIIVSEQKLRSPHPLMQEPTIEPVSPPRSVASSSSEDSVKSASSSAITRVVSEEAVVVGQRTASAGCKLDLRSDSIKSELDYDIKRYNLDGSSSVRSRKKSLENQVKKELSVAPMASAAAAAIKVSTRVSDLKSRFDSAPILPAVHAARKENQSNSLVSTMKITLDRGSTKKGNERFRCDLMSVLLNLIFVREWILIII